MIANTVGGFDTGFSFFLTCTQRFCSASHPLHQRFITPPALRLAVSRALVSICWLRSMTGLTIIPRRVRRCCG
jgi:hypothetical protein